MGTERISRALEGNGALSGLSGLFGGVFDAACASLLALTYDRRVSAFRPLSRSAMVSARRRRTGHSSCQRPYPA